MYFSYAFGSQGAQGTSPSEAIEIPSSSTGFSSVISPTCAFPSWPRRSSLSNSSETSDADYQHQQSTSYITDEELFPPTYRTSPCTPSYHFTSHSPASLSRSELSTEPRPPPCQVVQNSARDLVRELVELEKAKRALKRRKNSTTSKNSRTNSGASKYMSPIME
ncbi:hypothetical protein GcC1_096009 [Golovinomyces cichoracearum]|uniref:Uncharacterized protein n=1 Tax=Golovinomyces cichoracearum TaxID=62708 RepID=A0A420IB79_9PEZI|nr:hypothetical protein GcC1_096009 [Golovinomyces cichoracearum]